MKIQDLLYCSLLIAMTTGAIAQTPNRPTSASPGSSLRTTAGEIVIEADSLVSSYSKDRGAAQVTFGGKQIAVYGKIDRIEKRMGEEGYFIQLESNDPKLHVVGVASEKYLNSIRYLGSGYKIVYEPPGMGNKGALHLKTRFNEVNPFLTPPDDIFLRGQVVGLSLGEVRMDLSEIISRRTVREPAGLGRGFERLHGFLTRGR